MDRSIKLLILLVFLIIALGMGFLFLGSKNEKVQEEIPSTTFSATDSAALVMGDRAFVLEVIDGDTIKLENGQIVRFLGVDTPETKDPRRPVGCFGKEASNETKNLLEGKVVILQKDISETDKYQRLLRYVFLPLEDGKILFVQDYLVREGFAQALTYPPDVKFNEQLREAERYARENNKGLWGRCD